jgi:hypothetical protein
MSQLIHPAFNSWTPRTLHDMHRLEPSYMTTRRPRTPLDVRHHVTGHPLPDLRWNKVSIAEALLYAMLWQNSRWPGINNAQKAISLFSERPSIAVEKGLCYRTKEGSKFDSCAKITVYNSGTAAFIVHISKEIAFNLKRNDCLCNFMRNQKVISLRIMTM